MNHPARLLLAPFLGVALALSSSTALAAFRVDGKPKVSFFAEGSPGALDIEGKTTDLTLVDDGTTVKAIVKLDTVTTGIDLRDRHMKEKYLHVDQYPEATLTLSRADLQLPTEVGKSTKGELSATFSCHGVDEPVTVTYTIKKSKTGYAVDASFHYNAAAHDIDIPSYLGITVSPEQHARARFNMIDE